VVIALAPFLRAENFSSHQTGPSLSREISSLAVPRLAIAPKLADFEGMAPATELARKMLTVEKFVQREPKDGGACSQRTEAYLGYTDKNFYAIFLAFDTEPRLMRAHMLRRELIDDDDQVGFFLDTFHDHRHSYMFFANPRGIQQDGLYTENGGWDNSWDTVWRTETKISRQGYMVLFEIPFKSLRFHPSEDHTWGILLSRVIPRNSERSYYPENSSRSQGWLVHEGDISGFKEISPGRNLQFIPYTSLRAFRTLDGRDPNAPNDRFTGKHLEPKAGLDSKVVIKDSLVLDATINPDFGQIESDDPQVTVNQRFEVFFPEKRPFFQENSNYFQTPINLVFTRRIIDPLYGVRLTGKLGPWAVGSLVANDRAPGKSVLQSDPLYANDAYFGILRVNREIGKNNSIGFIYTDRELHTNPNTSCTATPCQVGFNRVGGFDFQFKINQNWQMNGQAVTSESKFNDGSHQSGPAYQMYLERSSRKLEFNSMYQDNSAGFATNTGFFRRPDIRRFSNFANYRFRPEGKRLVAHGPNLFTINLWDHSGTRLQHFVNANYEFAFQRNTFFGFFYNVERERLRPSDFSALVQNQDYPHHVYGPFFGTQFFKWLGLNGEVDLGTATNFVPRSGPPTLANFTAVSLRATIRPVNGLTIENTYFLTRLVDPQTNLSIFNNHIIRSKWNYQFTKEFSLRLIGQYVSTLPNNALTGPAALTSLQNTKQFNGDVLFTYMVHPGTAIYVGYNSDLQNLDPSLLRTADGLLRQRSAFINDGRQVFIKVSYLFRY